ncbi:DEAD/DEAH box helicase [Aneurinibacillus sp. Ricciae_BoGa-3]|uniref:DEAD/DEAH box helicase n=1 Tax=Aneurinibacillus sp. Ricciae_BoGa-3 TaxID=3022697 RepID=UPI0023419883|nr:DEAD/DEAH box helicase [Aneurinibacillus sp. Ricciae_BoGa-3]WCK55214.1 DEAD/DEAH box helicase [Aneurinibacillus sp. Ricciae_BoGa-3]
MSYGLSQKIIKLLCGATSYQRGEAYYRSHRVTRLNYDPENLRYDAVVLGSKRYNVHVLFDGFGNVHAECSCPAYHTYDTYCKHIAAVLLEINEDDEGNKNSQETAVSSKDLQLTNTFLSLFDNTSVSPAAEPSGQSKQLVDVEFICNANSLPSGKNMFTIEMKIGAKRLYVVKKIKEFLSEIESQTPYVFSKHFTFDPTEHAFKDTDWAIIQQLIELNKNEEAYRQNMSYSPSNFMIGNERAIFIPPIAWERLLLNLSNSNVKLEHKSEKYDQIKIIEGPIPLGFKLNKTASKGYKLVIQGLEDITVMENYGYIVVGGYLWKSDQTQSKRLAELKKMFQYMSHSQTLISPDQIQPFMEKVVPGLKKLGTVDIAAQISDRIVSPALQAKIYLDQEDERLQARLEYVYGDIMIEPMRPNSGNSNRSDRILIRDAEQENRIMRLFEDSAFKINTSELYIDEEESIYNFLYHVVPQLQKLGEVYITPALKSAIHQTSRRPKASVDVDSKTEWLEIHFDLEGIEEQEIRNILLSVVEKKKYHRLPNGSFLSLEENGFQEMAQLMDKMSVRKSEIKGRRIQLPVVRGFSLLDASEKAHSIKFGKSLRHLLENLRNPDNLDFAIPEKLAPVLRDYQKFGFQWMKTLAYYRFGGILADDMGLGKTLQSIAFIQSELQEKKPDGLPVLIVSPASLVYNWKNELIKFAPDLKTLVVAGDKKERSEFLSDVANVDVLITSYPLLRRDLELYENQRFHTLILDEAQAFKNRTTQTAQSVKAIQAKHRFALTGTPVENSLDELWSIFDAIFPELFSSKKAFSTLSREQIAVRVRPFILRRMKTDVLKELPEKIETIQSPDLSKEQKTLYAAYLSKLQQETIEDLQADGFQKSRMKILAGLTRLRQICCHPSLFVENYRGNSGKLNQLMDLIEEGLLGGRRMLIFSQFTEMLGIIRRKLEEKGLSCFYLDGKTPSLERVELCRRFNEGEENIFLISLKAGGTGLNLTGADTVILYDLWWNPAVEQQAADRAHRIGQKNVVQVIRLVTEGTIEEKMYELQQRKRDLIDQVIQPGEQALSTLTEKEIRELLMIGS